MANGNDNIDGGTRSVLLNGVVAINLIAKTLQEALGVTPVGVTTVAALPTTGVAQGARRLVTDANATTFASVVAAGGSNIVPVYFDGTSWRIG